MLLVEEGIETLITELLSHFQIHKNLFCATRIKAGLPGELALVAF